MAGYSGSPLPKKLGIEQGGSVALIDAPPAFEDQLTPLPEGVELTRTLGQGHDVIVWFNEDLAALTARFDIYKQAIDWAGGLWIAWPKKASKVPTDVSDAAVRALGLSMGLVDNKVCAIDHIWSGLRFVYRKADRPRR